MNLNQLKKSGWIIHECIVGSHLYNTNKEGSDVDIKGVYIQPTKEILKGNYFEQISDDKQDSTYYEIGRFIELLCKANPNMLDIIGSDQILYTTNLWKQYFPNPQEYITKKIKHTFSGYAHSQIQKAKGMNKKTNWEKSRMERKTPLDFCYILLNNESSIKIKEFFEIPENEFNKFRHWGLASINNFPDCYAMYYFKEGNAGICNEDSNDVCLTSIPKNYNREHILRFDRNAYSTHCKDYREYQDWLEKRNPLRYQDNAKVDNEYDTKNMMHCVRLLLTCKDLLLDKGLILKRPERDLLLSIRNGKISYNNIIKLSESLKSEVESLYKTSKLPREVNTDMVKELLLKIRLNHL